MDQTELKFLMEDTLDLSKRIIGMDRLVQSITDNSALREAYSADIADLICIYKEMEWQLELELVKEIQRLKEINAPADLTLCRVLKELQTKRL